jgi:hypothetical protein
MVSVYALLCAATVARSDCSVDSMATTPFSRRAAAPVICWMLGM